MIPAQLEKEKIRVLMAKIGLDSHERATKLIINSLKEAGMEVIYLGLFQTPQSVIAAALQEDADVIGISSLAGEETVYMPELMELVKKHCPSVPVILGGIIPETEISALKGIGISEVFSAGCSIASVVECIKELALVRRDTPGK